MLYRSFVMPHLLLHIEILGSSPYVHMSKLDIKINTLLRTIMGIQSVDGRPVVGTSDMYRQFGVLRLKNVYRLRMFRLLLTILNGHCPEFYNLLLRPYISVHNYRTRGRAFRHPLVMCEVERRAVSHQLINLYETIPETFRDQNRAFSTLMREFKRHLLASQ